MSPCEKILPADDTEHTQQKNCGDVCVFLLSFQSKGCKDLGDYKDAVLRIVSKAFLFWRVYSIEI